VSPRRTRQRARSGPDETSSEAERYRRAAEAALEQVDSCVEYLRRIHKRQLATRLADNSRQIRRKWM